MIQTFSLWPGVTLRCVQDGRFKQGCLSVQLVRPMAESEAAMNALLPAVLLRGTRQHPSLRAITLALDDLYGAAVSPLVRRVGDYQTTGLYCGFMDERFALPGDKVLEPMADFLRELLFCSPVEQGGFLSRYVDSEKKNLISSIECDRNDKQVYAMSRLLKNMCAADSFGVPRLGEPEQVAAITAQGLWEHYQRILRESRVEFFYVGSRAPEQVAQMLLKQIPFEGRTPVELPPQSGFHDCPGSHVTEAMDVTQGKLCLGFTTPVTLQSQDCTAMQLLNQVYGGGMTSKLFLNVREKQSLCYSISSGYYGAKGILTVAAGIDSASREQTQQEILRQLEDCAAGEITAQELGDAQQAMRSALQALHDSPGAIENYYATAALSGRNLTPAQYLQQVNRVEVADLVRMAQSVKLHSSFFLTEGGTQ